MQIPHFDRMLEIAAGCNAMTGLGYVGVDLVLDRDKGPLMLELNARPGLNIQIANRAGLAARLEAVDRAGAGKLPRPSASPSPRRISRRAPTIERGRPRQMKWPALRPAIAIALLCNGTYSAACLAAPPCAETR